MAASSSFSAARGLLAAVRAAGGPLLGATAASTPSTLGGVARYSATGLRWGAPGTWESEDDPSTMSSTHNASASRGRVHFAPLGVSTPAPTVTLSSGSTVVASGETLLWGTLLPPGSSQDAASWLDQVEAAVNEPGVEKVGDAMECDSVKRKRKKKMNKHKHKKRLRKNRNKT